VGLKVETMVGGSGQFDVLVNGELVASKQKSGLMAKLFGGGGWPDEGTVVEEIRKRASS
jgi:hypothetical protein